MQKSIEKECDNLGDTYLVHTRNFILDEVEADIVYLQNKTIGKNHIQWDPNYRYIAWYKATDKVVFGDTLSPKTDPGPFIIEKTGEVTAYACNSITMYPGFHAQQGGKYHTYVHCDGCSRPREQGKSRTNDGENQVNEDDIEERSFLQSLKENERHIESEKLKVFPNPSTKGFTIEFPEIEGEYVISNTNGKLFQQNEVKSKSIFIVLPKGIYFVKWINKNGIQTQKLIAL